MIRKVFTLGVIAVLLAAETTYAAPRGGGGGGGFRGGGGGTRGGVAVRGGYVGRGVYGGYGRGYGGYGGYGFGIGLGTGLGLGYLFSPGGYGYIPYSGRGEYAVPGSYVIPADMASDPQTSQWGLKITDVLDGSAKKADLRVGDVILGVGQTQTQSFEELQSALAASRGPVDVVFINAESRKVEKLPVTPVNGKIGVAVNPVPVP
jgi:hypothetical protein